MVLCHLPWFICRVFSRISVEAFALNLWNHPGICLNTQPILFGSPKHLYKHFPKYLVIFTALGNDTFFLLAPTRAVVCLASVLLFSCPTVPLHIQDFSGSVQHPSLSQLWEQFLCTLSLDSPATSHSLFLLVFLPFSFSAIPSGINLPLALIQSCPFFPGPNLIFYLVWARHWNFQNNREMWLKWTELCGNL